MSPRTVSRATGRTPAGRAWCSACGPSTSPTSTRPPRRTIAGGGWRLARGPEVGFAPQVHFERASLDPAAAALRQLRRLRLLGDPQQPAVEFPRLGLPARRHRQLHVLDRLDAHTVRYTQISPLGDFANTWRRLRWR